MKVAHVRRTGGGGYLGVLRLVPVGAGPDMLRRSSGVEDGAVRARFPGRPEGEPRVGGLPLYPDEVRGQVPKPETLRRHFAPPAPKPAARMPVPLDTAARGPRLVAKTVDKRTRPRAAARAIRMGETSAH